MTIDSILLTIVIVVAAFIIIRDMWRTRKGTVKYRFDKKSKSTRKDDTFFSDFDLDD